MSKELILPGAASGTLTIGNDLIVNQIGYGAMRITGAGIWDPPADKEAALATLRAVSRSCRSYGIPTFNQIEGEEK